MRGASRSRGLKKDTIVVWLYRGCSNKVLTFYFFFDWGYLKIVLGMIILERVLMATSCEN